MRVKQKSMEDRARRRRSVLGLVDEHDSYPCADDVSLAYCPGVPGVDYVAKTAKGTDVNHRARKRGVERSTDRKTTGQPIVQGGPIGNNTKRPIRMVLGVARPRCQGIRDCRCRNMLYVEVRCSGYGHSRERDYIRCRARVAYPLRRLGLMSPPLVEGCIRRWPRAKW